jgi:hypothetical protein
MSEKAPILTDITPGKYRCGTVGTMCPTIMKTDRKTYIIIGKLIRGETYREIGHKIGDDEEAIEISAELLEETLSQIKAV